MKYKGEELRERGRGESTMVEVREVAKIEEKKKRRK